MKQTPSVGDYPSHLPQASRCCLPQTVTLARQSVAKQVPRFSLLSTNQVAGGQRATPLLFTLPRRTPLPPHYYDDGIDSEVGSQPPRFLIDDDAESALGEAARSQQAEIRKKLSELAGITPEQISEMIRKIRDANKEFLDLTPKAYIERSRNIAYDTLGKRYGAGAVRELLGTVPRRPLLIRVVQEETEDSEQRSDNVPTSDGGQASAEPHLPKLTIAFPASKSLEFRTCTYENTPDLLFAWWFLGNGPFHCPWKINITMLSVGRA